MSHVRTRWWWRRISGFRGMVSLSKVRARCETVRKDRVRGKDRKRAHVFACLLSSFVCACFCKACVWSCAYRDDGRWLVYAQSADSATIALTINCLFPPCVHICVCGVVNGVWCAAGQRYCSIHLIFLPPASHNLHPAAPLKPLCLKIPLLCLSAHKYLFLHTLLFIFMSRMWAYLLVNLPQHSLDLHLCVWVCLIWPCLISIGMLL